MFGAFLGVILASPFVAFFGAIFRATILFFPTMLMLGVVHGFLPWVPALGWTETFAVLTLISLLIPVGTTASATSSSR